MSTFGFGYSIKQAATSGYTLGTGEYAVVTYQVHTPAGTSKVVPPATVHYGPGQTIAASMQFDQIGGFLMDFFSGCVFKNT